MEKAYVNSKKFYLNDNEFQIQNEVNGRTADGKIEDNKLYIT